MVDAFYALPAAGRSTHALVRRRQHTAMHIRYKYITVCHIKKQEAQSPFRRGLRRQDEKTPWKYCISGVCLSGECYPECRLHSG